VLAEEDLSIGVGIVSAPLDLDDELMERAMQAPWVLVAEDHGARTGLWASVAEWLTARGIAARVVSRGVDGYQSSGAAQDLLARAGLDVRGLADAMRELAAEA